MIVIELLDDTYVRLVKLQGRTASAVSTDAAPLCVGYAIDGWFLETPAIGRPLSILRFRRNDIFRLGVFSSSLVTQITESEIRTANSVYKFEIRSFRVMTVDWQLENN